MFNLLVYLTIFLIVNFILITIVWNYYSTKIQLLITKKGEKEQVLGMRFGCARLALQHNVLSICRVTVLKGDARILIDFFSPLSAVSAIVHGRLQTAPPNTFSAVHNRTEQLRMESIELKLPKDYTPRI